MSKGKKIGQFTTRAEALRSVDARRDVPGFRDCPDHGEVDSDHPACRLVGLFESEAEARAMAVEPARGEIRTVCTSRVGGPGNRSDGFVVV